MKRVLYKFGIIIIVVLHFKWWDERLDGKVG